MAAMRPAPSVFSARMGAVGVANRSVLAAPEARTSGPCASPSSAAASLWGMVTFR